MSATQAGERRWFIGGESDEYGAPIPVDYDELVGEGIKMAGILERFGGHFQIAAYRVEVGQGLWITHGVAYQLLSYSPGKRQAKVETNGAEAPEPEVAPEPEPVTTE